MQVSTHLRKDKIDKDGLAPIRMLISGDGVKIFKVIPGIKCKLNNWDETKGRLKPFKKNEGENYEDRFKKCKGIISIFNKLDKWRVYWHAKQPFRAASANTR